MHAPLLCEDRRDDRTQQPLRSIIKVCAVCLSLGILLSLFSFGCVALSMPSSRAAHSRDLVFLPGMPSTRPVGAYTWPGLHRWKQSGAFKGRQPGRLAARVEAAAGDKQVQDDVEMPRRRNLIAGGVVGSLVGGFVGYTSHDFQAPDPAAILGTMPAALSDLTAVSSLREGREALANFLTGVEGSVADQQRALQRLPDYASKALNLTVALPDVMQIAKDAGVALPKEIDAQRIKDDILAGASKIPDLSSQLKATDLPAASVAFAKRRSIAYGAPADAKVNLPDALVALADLQVRKLQEVSAPGLEDVRKAIAASDQLLEALAVAWQNDARQAIRLANAEQRAITDQLLVRQQP